MSTIAEKTPVIQSIATVIEESQGVLTKAQSLSIVFVLFFSP